jgi:hypothetical protein
MILFDALARLRALVRSARAISTVETALVAPFLGVMMLGIIDFGSASAQDFGLQQAAHRAIELATANSSDVADPDDFAIVEEVQAEAAAAAGIPTDQVEVTRWLECDGERMDAYDGGCSTGEDEARFIRVALVDSYAPQFGSGPLALSGVADDSGLIPLSAAAATRVE